MKNRILLLMAVFALPLFMQANNIRVKLNSYTAATKQLNITLAWDNSWHDGSGTFRDAAWLFVKYKDVNNGEWQHAILTNPTSTNNLLTDTLSGANVKFDVLGKNPNTAGVAGSRGFIIRRAKSTNTATQYSAEYAGNYNVAMSFNVTLATTGNALLANPEIRVYALEMVDIPAGAYYAGDGSPNSYIQANTTTNAPFIVSNETSQVPFTQTTPATYLAAGFPRATYEYYMLKYEVSNEAFSEYMNTLTRAQQNLIANGGLTNAASGAQNVIARDYGYIKANVTNLTEAAVFGCDANNNGVFNELNDGQNNGVIIEKMNMGIGYLDWAALRIMTGYEYEKACRGPLYPVPNEYAWGSAVMNLSIIDVDNFGPNESPSVPVDGPRSTYNQSVRNGAYAKPTGATRLNSGGSYYGVMELGNSCGELSAGYGYYGADSWLTSGPGNPLNSDGIFTTPVSHTLASHHQAVSFNPTQRVSDASYSYGSSPIQVAIVGIRGILK